MQHILFLYITYYHIPNKIKFIDSIKMINAILHAVPYHDIIEEDDDNDDAPK